MPRQIPSSGVPVPAARLMAAVHSPSSAAVAPKCPTPGTTMALAPASPEGSAGVNRSAPAAANPLRTDVRFPAP